MKLVIGNKNYSSWSLRPWLYLAERGIDHDVEVLSLYGSEFKAQIRRYSTREKVPVLVDGDLVIPDTLAICEYLSEAYDDGEGWPRDLGERANARSLVAEMHSGLPGIRSELPMNLRRRIEVPADRLSEATRREIDWVDSMWSDRLAASGGPWLFGERFGIVDAFYAVVALRFRTYGTDRSMLSDAAADWVETVATMPALQPWLHDAEAEEESVEAYDALYA